MKIRILFRQVQKVSSQNQEKLAQLEHRSDLACVRMGIPLPVRMRPLVGAMELNMRISEREFRSIADYTRLYAAWQNDEECRQIDKEYQECCESQRQEILYVDDNNDPIIPWIQMAAEQGKTIKYTVNPNYTMPQAEE